MASLVTFDGLFGLPVELLGYKAVRMRRCGKKGTGPRVSTLAGVINRLPWLQPQSTQQTTKPK